MQNIQSKKTLFIGLLIAATFGAMFQPAALAVVSDPTTYSTLQQQRRSLLVRETELIRDKNDLQRQIDDLRRAGGSSRDLSDLSQALDQTYSDLRATDLDIKDIERRLM